MEWSSYASTLCCTLHMRAARKRYQEDLQHSQALSASVIEQQEEAIEERARQRRTERQKSRGRSSSPKESGTSVPSRKPDLTASQDFDALMKRERSQSTSALMELEVSFSHGAHNSGVIVPTACSKSSMILSKGD